MRILDSNNYIVGESPVYNEMNETLYYIDIRGKSVTQFSFETGNLIKTEYPQEIGCIALDDKGGLFAAMQDGIYYLTSDGRIVPFVIPDKICGRRFNDGKVGPDGYFYVGTTSTLPDIFDGAFYRVSPAGEIDKLLSNVGNSNGLCWSKDTKTMYYCDTRTHKIESFYFDAATHSIHNRKTILHIPLELGSPDGMTIDADDNLWIALWKGAAIIKVDPLNGQILKRLKFPTPQISCCAFVGRNLSELAVTSSSFNINISDDHFAGNTFLIESDAKGVPTNRFRTVRD